VAGKAEVTKWDVWKFRWTRGIGDVNDAALENQIPVLAAGNTFNQQNLGTALNFELSLLQSAGDITFAGFPHATQNALSGLPCPEKIPCHSQV
jgi:hypothetical protein